MKSQALGLIETVGLPTAVEAADAAIKAADVTLVGYEKAKGGGWIVIKLRGDVGAVKAAVEAGVMAAERIGKVKSWHIIPRPADDTELFAGYAERGPAATPPMPPVPEPALKALEPRLAVIREKKPRTVKKAPITKEPESSTSETPLEDETEPTIAAVVEEEFSEPIIVIDTENQIEPTDESMDVTRLTLTNTDSFDVETKPVNEICNMCGDPACPRLRGQPHKLCIHHAAKERGDTAS